MAHLGINLEDVNPDDASVEALPKDTYHLQVVETELKMNSKGTGQLLEYKAEVVSGDFAGRKIYERLNVSHENPVAQKIGQAQLKQLALAAGIQGGNIQDSDELLYQPFYGDVDIESYKDRNGNDKLRNVIKAFHYKRDEASPPDVKHANDNAKAPPAANTNTKPAAAAGAGTTSAKPNMPWKRG